MSSILFISKCFIFYSVLLGAFLTSDGALAEETSRSQDTPQVFREDKDGVIEEGEYEVMNPNGSLTRRSCPYSCENRGIPREYCREWKSRNAKLCYVHDTRLPQGAVPLDAQ